MMLLHPLGAPCSTVKHTLQSSPSGIGGIGNLSGGVIATCTDPVPVCKSSCTWAMRLCPPVSASPSWTSAALPGSRSIAVSYCSVKPTEAPQEAPRPSNLTGTHARAPGPAVNSEQPGSSNVGGAGCAAADPEISSTKTQTIITPYIMVFPPFRLWPRRALPKDAQGRARHVGRGQAAISVAVLTHACLRNLPKDP